MMLFLLLSIQTEADLPEILVNKLKNQVEGRAYDTLSALGIRSEVQCVELPIEQEAILVEASGKIHR
jgi:hypothetical protein